MIYYLLFVKNEFTPFYQSALNFLHVQNLAVYVVLGLIWSEGSWPTKESHMMQSSFKAGPEGNGAHPCCPLFPLPSFTF